MGSGKRGGKRKGAGRKAGALAKKTRQIAELAIDEGITPLEVMLKEMRFAAAAGDSEMALEAAKAAAPYIHPKLSAVQVTGKDGAAVQIERIERVIVDPQNPDP